MEEKTKERFDPQESFCYYALQSARELAAKLMDEKGQAITAVGPMQSFMWKGGYSEDAIAQHQKRFLSRWNSQPSFVQKFRRFSLPLCHAWAEQVIRSTLDLPLDAPLADFHVKRAAIAACLTPLRQSVGSCFATAPALEIQQFHIDLFIEDIYQLLTRGKLTRVVDGVEYTAPFCLSVNLQNPFHNALLKVWEYTLASYCDIKMEFSKWNLGWSVGLPPQEKEGIGSVLYKFLEEKLHTTQTLLQKRYQETTLAHEQLRAVEVLSHQVQSEDSMRRLKAEAIAKAHHLETCHQLYQETERMEKSIAEMLPFLIQQYTALFQNYFQEIYDPDFTKEEFSLYEDRMAGFRLVYKHGRSDSSLWTAIYNRQQFISALDDFFRSTETTLAYLCKEGYEKNLIAALVTEILHHIHTPSFFDHCMARAKTRGRLPWAYSAGGSIEQIVPLYYRRSSPLRREERVVQDEIDLFTFIVETLKSLPPSLTYRFNADEEEVLLFQSPTHVCLLLPGMPTFFEAWNDRGLTYTWIRDKWIHPSQQFYREMILSKEEQKELYRRLRVERPVKNSMGLEEFCREVHHLPPDILASFLFQTLPLIPIEKCQALLHTALPAKIPYLSSEEYLRVVCQAFPHQSIDGKRERMRQQKWAAPSFLFADTNWPNGYFSFVIHPVTLQLEVWKTDRAGVTGAPLSLVKTWFKSDPWLIFFK